MQGNGRGWLAGVLCVGLAASAQAAVIRVEQDGSGDYLTVQEGIDAAQPGDTVRIGPGRYDTFSVRVTSAGGRLQVVGFVTTSDLTIEGLGATLPVIGPSTFTPSLGGLSTAGLVIDRSASRAVVRGLRMEHLQGAVSTLADDVRFEALEVVDVGEIGVQLLRSRRVEFHGCSFVRARAGFGIWIVAQLPSHDILIENCTFESFDTGVSNGAGTNVTVRDCRFDSNDVGVQYWAGATGSVETCEFEGKTYLSVVAADAATSLGLSDCTIGPAVGRNVSVHGGRVAGRRNYFAGGAIMTILVGGGNGYVSFSDSVILNAGGLSVFADPGFSSGEPFIDLRYNYWGTTDRAQIEAWIQDQSDWPQFTTLPVVFEPFLDQPIGTESQTMGELKARFAEPR